MTDDLFFDTDCFSSFLWVSEENLLLKLYKGRIILPQDVFNELSHPSIMHLKRKLDALLMNGDISTMQILMGTEEYKIFQELAIKPRKGFKLIGKGEAAALALAKVNDGIIASNNIRDIKEYIEQNNLKHITTGDILVELKNNGMIDEIRGNEIWIAMKKKRRFLPAATFTDYLRSLY